MAQIINKSKWPFLLEKCLVEYRLRTIPARIITQESAVCSISSKFQWWLLEASVSKKSVFPTLANFSCPNVNIRRSLSWKTNNIWKWFGKVGNTGWREELICWFLFSMKMSKGRFVFFVWLTLVFNVIVIQRWDSLVVLFNNLFVIMWVGFEQNLAPIKTWIKNPQKQNPVDPYPWAEK